jgi:hypothetical protein
MGYQEDKGEKMGALKMCEYELMCREDSVQALAYCSYITRKCNVKQDFHQTMKLKSQ